MATTRRLFKAIRKPDLLSTVGKAPRTQVNCKKGLWAVKAHHGEVFSDIMEAIRQLCVGTETSTTNPSFSPLISDVTEQHAVLFSVTVADEVSLASPKPTSDDTVVPNVTTNGAALACAHELDPEIVCLDLLPSVTEYDPSPMSLASDRAEDYVDLCYSSFTPMTDVVVDVSSAATVIGLNLADMVEPLKLETVESFRLDGLISNEENHRPDSAMAELIGMKNEWNKEFALVYQCCKLGNFTQARRVLWDEVKFSLDSSMITYASSSYGNIGEENLFATDKYGHMLVNVVMGAMTQPSLSQVSPTPHFNYQDVRRAFVCFLSAVIKPYNHNPLHSKVGEETWPLDDMIEKLNGDADTLFDSRSTSKITLDSLLVATDLTSQMVPLGGSGMDNKREIMPMVIDSSLSWMAILLLCVIRMETDEKRRPLIRRWLVYCSLLCHFKEKVSTLAKYAYQTVQVVTKLDVMGSDTDEAPNIFLGQIGSSEYDRFAEDGQFFLNTALLRDLLRF